MSAYTLHHGDCRDVLATMDESSVDAIVTDPPYGLGFMGREWDGLPPGVKWATECLRVLKPGGHLAAFGGTRTYHRLTCGIEDAGFEVRDCLAWLYGSGFPKSLNLDGEWDGWGTALKPAHEPIVLARKPLTGTVLGNVSAHGTGAVNVDGCRSEVGRWPTNVILDDEAAAMLDAQSGVLHSQHPATRRSRSKVLGVTEMGTGASVEYADRGGASRFFYIAKASKADRGEGNTHPTVKPVDLMRWLVRLVTPPGGTVLDPFAGSGTTGVACLIESFPVVLIEREDEYVEIIRQRLSRPIEPVLFGGAA